MIPLPAIWLLASFQVALSQHRIPSWEKASPMKFPHIALIEGCYYKHARYHSPFSQETNATSIHQCQQKCVASTKIKCFFFNFFPSTGACLLAPADAAFTAYLSKDAYAGPKVCPQEPVVCTDLPTPAFPAADSEMSKMAWPMHMVPPKLGCWPKDFVGKKFKNCPRVTAVEDTATGWPGKCLGLDEVVVPYKETCQSWCEKQPGCSVWQEVDQGGQTACFQTFWSSGYNCYQRIVDGKEDLDFKPIRAQRLMKGEVRVLKKLSFVHIDGLKRVFDENYFAKHEDGVKACQTTCYSDLGCQWWIYSRVRGCYVEDISHQRMPVPMTTDTFQVFARAAQEVLDGEYIQHQCKELPYADISSKEEIPEFHLPTTATGTTTPEPAETTTLRSTSEMTYWTTAGIHLVTMAPSHSPQRDERASSQVDPKDLKLLGVGALVVKGIDLNLVDSTIRYKLSDRYAELIAANTRLSKYDVLDLNNKAGHVTLESWQTGNPVIRRLQTAEPGFKAAFKLSEKGKETYAEAAHVLTSDRFYLEVQGETAAMLKHTPVGGKLPRVQAVMRQAQDSDFLPLNAERKQVSNANAELWMFILGFILVALIIGILIWLFGSASQKKVSFTRKAETKLGSFRKLGDEDPEDGQVNKGGKASKKNGAAAASPSRREIQEAEMRAVQVASRLSEEVDVDDVPSGARPLQGYASGSMFTPTPQVNFSGSPYATPVPVQYNSGQYQMPSLAPGYPGPRVIR